MQVLTNQQAHILELLVILDFKAALACKLFRLAEREYLIRQLVDTLLPFLGVTLNDAVEHRLGTFFQQVVELFTAAIIEYGREIQ